MKEGKKIGLPQGYNVTQEIEVKSEQEQKELMDLMRKSIFRPVDQFVVQELGKINAKLDSKKEVKLTRWQRINRWYKDKISYPILKSRQKSLTMRLIKQYDNEWTFQLKDWYVHAGSQMEKRSRFNVIHNYMKSKLMYPAMRTIAKKVGKYLVQNVDDIPNEWYNVHARMFYHSFEQGLFDMWYYFKFGEKSEHRQKYKTFADYVNGEVLKAPSHKSRMMALNIALTEVLEDTVDREWFNSGILRLTHEMMEFYGVSEKERKKVPKVGEFPIFLVSIESNPKYFFENRKMEKYNVNHKEDRYECQRTRKEIEM